MIKIFASKFRFAAIYFSKRSDALNAIKSLNGMSWNGRKLLIDFSYKHTNLRKEFKNQDKKINDTHNGSHSTRDSHLQENSFSSNSKKTKLNVDC